MDQNFDRAPILELRDISKFYGAFSALSKVNFRIFPGEVHSLLGENGAGKSTLIKVLTGATSCDAGKIIFEGKEIELTSTADAQSIGISCVYQEVNLLQNISVAENIMMGRLPRRFGLLRWNLIEEQARNALQTLNIDIDVRLPLSHYSIAIQQLVAIARAVAVDAKIVVLDEPTSSLDDAEVQLLMDVIRKLKAKGISFVFITHFLDQVDAISDRISVLRNGEFVGEYLPSDLNRMSLISKMIGKELITEEMESKSSLPTEVQELFQLIAAKAGTVGPISITIRKGETVGLGGLLGSGRSETAKMIFGIDNVGSGVLKWKGVQIKNSKPINSIRKGIGLVPEDRKLEGIIPNLSIRENMALVAQTKRGWLRPISRKNQTIMAEEMRKALSIATDSIEKPMNQLSGGNQQKAILGRWLLIEPELLLLDEPTRGIDIGARYEIEKYISKLNKEGIGILMISSEIDELQRCAHRLVVLRDGKVVGELPHPFTTQEVVKLMAGA